MNRVNTFLVMLALAGGGLSAKAQVYNEDDKEGLRMFLRQPSAISGQINAEQLGLDISDTLNWQSDETWVAKVIGVTWNTTSPKRLNGIYTPTNWNNKNLAGNLDATKWTALQYLSCSGNKLTALDISNNKVLLYLYCENNQLANLNVNNTTTLKDFRCTSNQLASLDISTNTALTRLNCGGNSLTQLDVSENTALTELQCATNQLTELDISKNPALTCLNCSNNQLTELDVSTNTALTELYCNVNKLTELDVSVSTALTTLYCNNNQLTELDVSTNTALINLRCYNCQLTKLDVSKNTALTTLYAYNNHIPLSDLFAASEVITNQNSKELGTQKISINANVGEVLFEGTEDIFKDTVTQYSNVKKNGTTASSSDYTINNGTIQFNDIGKYEVTMTNAAIVSNSSQPAKVIATITVSFVQISGKITHQNQTPLTSGTVQLYDDEHKLVKDTTIASNGSYVFLNVANGDYRVRVEEAGNVLRTYYGNTQYWDSAKIVTIANNQSIDTVDITVIELPVLPKGTSFITGTLEEDTVGKKQKGVGEPVVDESVTLQRSLGGNSWQTVAVSRTDANGHFEFSDVPAATYRFSVDIMGLKLLDNKVTSVADGDTVAVELTMKEIGIETGVEELRIFNYELRVYPNPTSGQLTISIDNGELKENTVVEIYSVVGQRLTLKTLTSLTTLESLGRVTIDISHLAKGMYFLKIGNKVVKFVKE